jgi:sugar phosphate permease
MTTQISSRIRRLRWIAFALVVTAYVLSFFHRVAPSTIAGDLQQAFGTTAAELGALAAMYFYVYTLMQVPVGVLADTLGPRRLLTLGGLVAGVGSIGFALAESLAGASAGRFLVGLGVSVTFVAMLKLHANWFHDRHFGTATGLSILLGNVGAVLATLPLAWALQYASWRLVFVVVGGLSLAIAILSALWLRNDPREAGLPTLRELDGQAPHTHHEGHWWQGLKEVLRNRATWPAFWVNLGLAGSYFAFAGLWAVPYLRDAHGLARTEATHYTLLMLTGFAAGALTVGALSDRLGRRRPVLLVALGLYLLCWLPLLAGAEIRGAAGYVLFALMGLGAAGFTLSWACVKEVNRHALSGMSTSIANTGAFLGAGLLQPLVGRAIDLAAAQRGGAIDAADYHNGLWLLFGAGVIGYLGALRVRETFCRYQTVR